MRKKKTPEELAAEAEQEDLDDFTSKYQEHFQIEAVCGFCFRFNDFSDNLLPSHPP
jgi:hypothetical protein